MKSFLLLISLCALCHTSQAQIFAPGKFIPGVHDYPIEQKKLEYKWPYIYYVPKYIGLNLGVQGFGQPMFQGGLALNLLEFDGVAGGMLGANALYKRNFAEDVESYNFELGVYTFFCLGLNFNYNIQNEYGTFGVKPFIGIALYNFQLLYGFNFFSKKNNQIPGLRSNHFELRYVIPLIAFGKSEKYVPAQSNYPNPYFYNSGGRGEYIIEDIQLR